MFSSDMFNAVQVHRKQEDFSSWCLEQAETDGPVVYMGW